jgi:alkyl sulfatase BDS1-like metallo-beta-lactamase superfamily hydrolase
MPRYGSTDANPTATLTLNRSDLDDVIIGEASFPALIQSGKIRIDGDAQALLGWFMLHSQANPLFNVVVP